MLTPDDVIIFDEGIHLNSPDICVSRTFTSSFVTTRECSFVGDPDMTPEVFNTLKLI